MGPLVLDGQSSRGRGVGAEQGGVGGRRAVGGTL